MKVLHHQKIPDSVKQERFKKVLGCSTDKSRILITSKSGKLLIYQPRRNLFAKITDYSYTSYWNFSCTFDTYVYETTKINSWIVFWRHRINSVKNGPNCRQKILSFDYKKWNNKQFHLIHKENALIALKESGNKLEYYSLRNRKKLKTISFT